MNYAEPAYSRLSPRQPPSFEQSLINHACWRSKQGQAHGMNVSSCSFEQIVSDPRTFCLNQHLVKFLLILIGSVYLYTAVVGTNALQQDAFTYRNLKHFRLGTAHFFDLESIGVQNAGCNRSHILLANDNMSWLISKAVNVDGLFLSFKSNATCYNQSFSFSLEAGQTSGQTQQIGTASMRWTAVGVRWVNRSAPRCETRMHFDFRPPWPWYFSGDSILHNFLLGFGFLGISIVSFFETPNVPIRLLVLLSYLTSLITLISFLGFVSLGLISESFLQCWECLCWTMLATVLAKAAWAAIELLMLSALLFLAGRVLNDVALFQDPRNLIDQPGQPAACAALFLVGCLYWCRRRRLRARAIAGMAPYMARFDEAWAVLQADSEEAAALELLEEQAAAARPPSGGVRHFCRLLASERGDGSGLGIAGGETSASLGNHPSRFHRASQDMVGLVAADAGRPGSASSESDIRFEVPVTVAGTAGAPVASLDQLYTQALFLAPILSSACAEWAAVCGGTVDGCGSAASAVEEEEELTPELRAWVRAGMVKRPRRAARKAVACYGGDASRVLDVCRARIAFPAAAGMARCVALVRAQAPRVVLLRLRCGLSRTHDAAQRAGFRAATLCVRFDSEDTRRLGLENHVCEVQLVHEAFVQVLKDVDLGRYHAFREARPARVDGKAAAVASVRPRFSLERAARIHPSSGSPNCTIKIGAAEPQVDLEALPRIVDTIPCLNLDTAGGVIGGDVSESTAGYLCSKQESEGIMLGGVDTSTVSDVLVVAQEVYLRYALGFCGTLDRHVWNFEAAMHRASASSVLFSSRPINAFATTRMGRAFYLMMMVFLIAQIAVLWWFESGITLGGQNDVYRVLTWNTSEFLRLRAHGPIWFSHDECDVGSLVTSNGLGYQPDSNRTAGRSLNGYGLALLGGELTAASGIQSVSWSLERSKDDGLSWEPVGLCNWVKLSCTTQASEGEDEKWSEAGSALIDCWNGRLSANVPPNATVHVSFRADAALFWLSFGNYWIPAGMGGVVLAVVLKRASAVKYIVMLATGGFGVFCLFWGIYTVASGNGLQRAAFFWTGFYAVPLIWYALGVAFLSERHFVLMISITGFLAIAFAAILWLLIYQYQPMMIINIRMIAMLLTGWSLISISAVWYNLSQRLKRYAEQLVVDDFQCYDRIWQSVFQNQRRECMLLKEQVTKLHQSNSWRSVVSVKVVGSTSFNKMSRLDTGLLRKRRRFQSFSHKKSPVNVIQGTVCLDQLFVQALCLEPLLFDKLRLWSGSTGLYSGGMRSDGSSFTPFSEVIGGIYQDARARSRLKSAHRAIEKVIRSYGHDASRLCDVCRQTVVFADVAALSDCLSAIGRDPEARIVRIKNRLDPDYDAAVSTGYRDVNINLRVASQAAAMLGVDTHICEIQLVLVPIALLKSEHGHQCYITCRNLRAD